MAQERGATDWYPPLFTPEEVARIFKVSDDAVRQMIRKGQLPAIKFGRQYRVPKYEIDRLFRFVPKPVPEELVLNAYRVGLISTGKLAELLGISYHDTLDLLKERGIPANFGPMTIEELEAELRDVGELFPP